MEAVMKKAIVITFLFMGLVMFFTGTSSGEISPYNGYQKFVHNTRAEMYENALKLMDRGQPGDALNLFKKLYDDSVSPFSSALHLGSIYIQLGRYEDALNVYERMQEQHFIAFSRLKRPARKNMVYSHYYYNLGMLYKKLNRPADSVEAFKKVLKSHNYRVPRSSQEGYGLFSHQTPTQFYSNVHLQLGAAYLELGDKAGAEKQCGRLKELDPGKCKRLQLMIAKAR